MGCWIRFLVLFLRTMGECKSSTIRDGVDDDNEGKVEVLVPVTGLDSWTCMGSSMGSFRLE